MRHDAFRSAQKRPFPSEARAEVGNLLQVVHEAEAEPLHIDLSLSTVAGAVNAGNDTGVWSTDASGALRLVAREGADAPGTGGERFSGFQSLALPGVRGVAFVARLLPSGE